MARFEDKKVRAQYPTLGRQYEIMLATGYNEAADTKGKFVVFLQGGGQLELWESQLDAILPAASQQKFRGILTIIFTDVGTPQKQKLIPKVITEEL